VLKRGEKDVSKRKRSARKTLIHNLEVAASTNWIKLSGEEEEEDGRGGGEQQPPLLNLIYCTLFSP